MGHIRILYLTQNQVNGIVTFAPINKNPNYVALLVRISNPHICIDEYNIKNNILWHKKK